MRKENYPGIGSRSKGSPISKRDLRRTPINNQCAAEAHNKCTEKTHADSVAANEAARLANAMCKVEGCSTGPDSNFERCIGGVSLRNPGTQVYLPPKKS